MQAPALVSVRDVHGHWHVVETLPPKWATIAPGGCSEATVTLTDGARAPELQQGCLVRISTADSSDAVWSGRIAQPVRRVLGAATEWELPVEGTDTFFSDRNLKYAPAVTRFDAWELGSSMGPYRAGAGVAAGNVPWDEANNWQALMLTLPGGYIVGNDRSLARFNGFDDTSMRPVAIRGYHVEGATARHQSQFFSFLWHGQTGGTVLLVLTSTRAKNSRFQTTLDPDNPADTVLGYQFLGPPTDTNQETSSIKSEELWAAFYGLTVWAQLYSVDGTPNSSYAPLVTGLRASHVVTDLIGRGYLPAASRNPMLSRIAGGSSVEIMSLEYTGLTSPADILADLVQLEPDYFWWAGPADASTGAVPVSWQPWPGPSLLLPPGVVDYTESGADADLANALQYTYRGADAREHTAMKTVDAFAFPDTAGLPGIVEAPPIDLTSMASQAAADQVATAYLRMYATLPKSATAVVSVPVPDKATGAMIAPWHLAAGVVAHVPETGDDLRVTKCEVDAATATATLTLGTPRKTVQELVTQMSKRRQKAS